MTTVYMEIFAPVLFTPLSPSLSAGGLKTDSNVSNYLSFNTTLSGRIQDGAKLWKFWK